MTTARKIVLVSKTGYDAAHNGLLRALLQRKIRLFCAVGRDCERWEEVMDELVVGPHGEGTWQVSTTSHPDETTMEVVDFAEMFQLDEPSTVQIIEI